MAALALAALTLAALPAAAQSPAAELSAVLWIPAAGFDRWDDAFTLLDRFPKARLSIAVDPSALPANAAAALAERARQGRLELALRLEEDPWLPLLQSHSPGDAAERIASAKARHRAAFGQAPTGFVATGGALNAELARILAAQKFAWTAVSDQAGSDAWPVGGTLAVVPFRAPTSTEPFKAKPGEPPRAILLDEATGLLPPGGGLALIEGIFDTGIFDGGVQERWAPVTAAFPAAAAGGSPPEAWPAWARADAGELAERAVALYGRAAGALARYQNSGLARLETLDKAQAALRAAQSWRFHRPEGLAEPAAEKEYRARLRTVFKAIGQPAPEALLGSLSAGADAGGEDQAELAGRVRSGAKADRLWFENPPGSTGFSPVERSSSTAAAAAREAWALRRLDVSWDKTAIRFSLATARSQDAAGAARAPLHLHLYIDVNGLAGRGATKLLPGTQAFLRSVDGWEYALEVSSREAVFWRSTPQGATRAAEFAVRVDPKRSELSVSVPRSLLRGQPERWGFLLLALAADPAAPDGLLPGASGSPILGLLGALEEQKSLAAPETPVRRFSAARLDRNAPIGGSR